MKKIPVDSIDEKVHGFRGIDKEGCFRTQCDDECCKYGADVDKESYDLIVENRDLIEKEIGVKIEACFKKKWLNDEYYLGGNARQTRVGENGFCMMHMPKGKGCALYKLVHEKNLPRRMIPSICRLYPLTWMEEKLYISDDIHPTCNCMKKDGFSENILMTQKKEVEDIFDLKIQSP
jgi:hypothetical protein